MNEFERMLPLVGENGIKKLSTAHIAIFGVGGVGSYVVEALARASIGTFSIFDNDNVEISNINRQLIATHSTIGKAKVDIAEKRIKDINPKANVYTYNKFVDESNIDTIDFSKFDYVIDAIDSVKSKILIIKKAKLNNVTIISSMGTGNKLDPSKFKITDISKTSVCPLARIIRKELNKENVKNVKVLFSTEDPLVKSSDTISSISFVPSIAGLLIASEVIKDIIF